MTNYSEKEIKNLYYSIPEILKKYNHISTKSIQEKERKILDIYDIKERTNDENNYNYFYWSKKIKEVCYQKRNLLKSKTVYFEKLC